MANNTLLASDNFSSGSLAAGWGLPSVSAVQVCTVVTGSPNVAEPTALSQIDGQVWTGLSWPLDQISEVTLNTFTSETTTALILYCRMQTGGAKGGYEADILNDGTIKVYQFNTSGLSSQIGSTISGITIAAGDVWSMHAEGAVISIYQNFNLVFQAFDTTYLSYSGNGCPGFGLYSSVNVTHVQVSSWRGYSAVQQDGIWQKQGVIIPNLAADFTGGGKGVATSSQVLHEGNAQILSGTVYKIWFCGQQPITSNAGGNIGYAESLDGINWTRKSPYVLNGYVSPTVWKSGNTYYMFAQPITGFGTSAYAVLTSPDGVTWTLQNASGVGLGSAGAWDDTNIFGCGVVAVIGGTRYALYYANGTGYHGAGAVGTGLATSADGINWTKHVSNPVVANFGAQQAVFSLDNATFYIWGGEDATGRGGPDPFDPAQGVRYTVTNNFTTWADRTVGIHTAQAHELVNNVTGQTWISSVINIGGKTYGYTNSGQDGSLPYQYQIALAIAPAPLASIITNSEDGTIQIATDAFGEGAGSLPATWTTPTGGTALKIVAGPYVEPTTTNAVCQAVYTGASFNASQYSEVILHTLTGTLAQSLIWPTVRSSQTALTNYEGRIASPSATTDAAGAIYKRVAGTAVQIGPTVTITPQVGDVFRLSVITGSDGFPTLSLFQNGFLILQVQDQSSTPITSGNPGIQAFSSVAIADAQIASWAGGNANVIPNYLTGVNWSPVDCRDFATFPNTGVVQSSGAVFYTGQTSSNPALPPVDSNPALPAKDSRIVIPTNSRNNPPF